MTDPMGYIPRDIHSADIWSFNKVELENGAEGVSTSVLVNLAGKDDPSRSGPSAKFDLVLEISADLTLRQIEDQALEAAAAFMRRLGNMTAAEMRTAVDRGNQISIFKNPE